jgi:hypothetical protein
LNPETDLAKFLVTVPAVEVWSLEAACFDNGLGAPAPLGFLLNAAKQLTAVGPSAQGLWQEKHVEKKETEFCTSPQAADGSARGIT